MRRLVWAINVWNEQRNAPKEQLASSAIDFDDCNGIIVIFLHWVKVQAVRVDFCSERGPGARAVEFGGGVIERSLALSAVVDTCTPELCE